MAHPALNRVVGFMSAVFSRGEPCFARLGADFFYDNGHCIRAARAKTSCVVAWSSSRVLAWQSAKNSAHISRVAADSDRSGKLSLRALHPV